MEYLKTVAEYTGKLPEKFFKATLFRSDALLLGLNCLEPGQMQEAHDHTDQDKFYYVVEGEGLFQIGSASQAARTGDVIWAPAGVVHGVTNRSKGRLTLLVGIAPAP